VFVSAQNINQLQLQAHGDFPDDMQNYVKENDKLHLKHFLGMFDEKIKKKSTRPRNTLGHIQANTSLPLNKSCGFG
jgi:hypothetical protein